MTTESVRVFQVIKNGINEKIRANHRAKVKAKSHLKLESHQGALRPARDKPSSNTLLILLPSLSTNSLSKSVIFGNIITSYYLIRFN